MAVETQQHSHLELPTIQPGQLYAVDGSILPSANGLRDTEITLPKETDRRHVRNLIFASWRLPEEEKNGVRIKMTGGLAHAAMDFFHDTENNDLAHGMTWVGCLGAGSGRENMPFPEAFGNDKTNGVVIDGFTIPPDIIKLAYLQKANGDYWFLQHGEDKLVENHPEAFDGYREFNRLFAERIAMHEPTEEDFIWIQDYQLLLAGDELRKTMGEQGEKLNIGLFIHIPWTTPEKFSLLQKEERKAVLKGILTHNIVGVQAETHRDNLIACIEEFLCNDDEIPLDEKPVITKLDDRYVVRYKDRNVIIKQYPISVSPEAIQEAAATDEALEEKEAFEKAHAGKEVALHVSRDEPTKKHLELIKGVRQALRVYPELRGSLELSAVLAPGRDIQAYKDYTAKRKLLVDEVNQEFQEHGKVVFVDPQIPRERVIGRMSADVHKIMTMNSDQEGLGLTVKESGLVSPKDNVTMMGIQTGAYQELGANALPIHNSNDSDEIANTIYYAMRVMPLQERMEMRSGLQAHIEKADIRKWFYDFMTDAVAS